MQSYGALKSKHVDAADGGPYVSATQFRLTTRAGATWETFGPTGSGATNIWTALDGVPAWASWVELRVTTSAGNGATGGQSHANVYARKVGSAVGFVDEAAVHQVGGNAAANSMQYGTVTVKIPLDSARKFEATWAQISGSTAVIDMAVVGYG